MPEVASRTCLRRHAPRGGAPRNAPAALRPLVLAATLTAATLPPVALRAQQPAPKDQVAAALLAAPDSMRASATVLGWTGDGRVVTLRKGDGPLVCLGDDPRDEYWSVACYHRALEPFMARGRELVRQGITGEKREEIRWTEIRDGKLKLPYGSTLYVLGGKGFDPATGAVDQPYLRWVIYTPGATSASTGLPTKAREPGEPWLMFAGTPGAHIMITPARQ